MVWQLKLRYSCREREKKKIFRIQISIILRLPEILINNSSPFSTPANFRNALSTQLFFCSLPFALNLYFTTFVGKKKSSGIWHHLKSQMICKFCQSLFSLLLSSECRSRVRMPNRIVNFPH